MPTQKSDPIIKFANVTKTYKVNKAEVSALNDVSFQINKGEFVAIMGPSGSGKSTLLQMLGALDKPTSGTIIVNGNDLNTLKGDNMADYHGRVVSFVFQSYYLQPFMPVLFNVELPLFFQKVPETERKERAIKALTAVGLQDKQNYLPKQLSGGQTQRVAIARALVNEPLIILADEPTANLDKENTEEILNNLQKINREFGTTIVVVTHNDLVAKRARRVLYLQEGRLK